MPIKKALKASKNANNFLKTIYVVNIQQF